MRTVLITGTSSGFGLAATTELAKRGWNVIATMRNLERRAALDEAVSRAGVWERVSVELLDVTEPHSVDAAVTAVLEKTGGRLDAVVHNAGVAVGAFFEDLPESDERRVMETNFFGVLRLTRALLPVFRTQRRGRILIVSSDSAFSGEPANSIYCASKWAVEGWAESLAFEVCPFGIDVILVEPGPYRTGIWDNSPRIKPPDSAYRPILDHLEKTVDEYVRKNARDPQEVAAVIAQALETAHPRFRYPVSADSWIRHILRGKIPSRVQRWAIRRWLGLHRVKV